MSPPSKTLNAQIDWERLLHILHIETIAPGLPARIECPECQRKRLLILQDHRLGGQWHYCYGCGIRGDMVDLAAVVWKLPLQATVIKLLRLGFDVAPSDSPADVAAAFREYSAMRQDNDQQNEFWEEASDGRAYSRLGSMACVQHLPEYLSVPIHNKQRVLKDLFGTYRASDITEAIRRLTASQKRISKTGRPLKAGNPVLGGLASDPSHAIVVPYYDVPGRICGYSFLWSYRRHKQIKYHSICRQRAGTREAGLSFHPEMMQRRHKTLYAFPDCTRYLLQHVSSARVSSRHLPYVLWHSNGAYVTQHAWEMFRDRQVIVWAPEVTWESLYQAICCNGQLGWFGQKGRRDPQITAKIFREINNTQVMERLRRLAIPWPERLNKFLLSATKEAIESLFLPLQLRGVSLDSLLANVSKPAANTARAAMEESSFGVKRAAVGTMIVEERNNCWFRSLPDGAPAGSETLLSDATLRIDYVVRFKKQEKVQYCGRILFRGKEVPFVADKEAFDSNPFRWMSNHLIEQGLGLMQYQPAMSKKVPQLAQRLKRPRLLEGLDRVGWCEDKNAFRFPRFEISFGGDVSSPTHPATIPHLPGSKLPVPGDLYYADIASLTADTEANRAFWAAWCLVAANVIAPALRRPTVGICVRQKYGAPVIAAVVEAFGLTSVKPGRGKLQSLLNAESDGLPLHFEAGPAYDKKHRGKYIAASEDQRNCILPADSQQTLAAAIGSDWQCVYPTTKITLDAEAVASSPRLLPNFLHFLCSRRFQDFHHSANPHQAVFAAVSTWLSQLGADVTVIEAAKPLSSVWSKPDRVADLLILCLANGGIRTTHQDFAGDKNTLIKDDDGNIFVPKRTLAACYRQAGLPTLDFEYVHEQLATSPEFLEATSAAGESGWWMGSKWWRRASLAARNKSVKLRIHRDPA